MQTWKALICRLVAAGVKQNSCNLCVSSAPIQGCNFEDPSGVSKCVLEGANLKGACLEGSNMAGVNLRVANLKNANLKNCNLRAAILAGADLEVHFPCFTNWNIPINV